MRKARGKTGKKKKKESATSSGITRNKRKTLWFYPPEPSASLQANLKVRRCWLEDKLPIIDIIQNTFMSILIQ